jgi:hypothetical protein
METIPPPQPIPAPPGRAQARQRQARRRLRPGGRDTRSGSKGVRSSPPDRGLRASQEQLPPERWKQGPGVALEPERTWLATDRVRVTGVTGGFVLWLRTGGTWERQAELASLDGAVELGARLLVERRFRAGHPRLPLGSGLALVLYRGCWQLEMRSRLRGEVRRTRSWPSIYRALSSGTRGGLASQYTEPIRGGLYQVHLEAVAGLRNAACDTKETIPVQRD